jgi:hypothetical protein
MGKESNIVHQYFKKETKEGKILVQLNPIQWKGVELFVSEESVEKRELTFDSEILDDLKHDGFTEVNAIEFNLYLSGLL